MGAIHIKQVLRKTGDADYEIVLTIGEDDPIIYKFEKTNGIYPLYQTLISAIRQFEGVTVNLSTESRFGKEVRGVPNQNTRLLEILRNEQARREIVINVLQDE